MRRRELAVGVTSAAGVAQIGEIIEVAVGERAAHLHRRKHRAEALAVAAGIADRHQAVGFFQNSGSVHVAPLCILWGYLVRPLPSSHFWIRPATSALFLSIMIMCELPLMPACGRSTTSTLPPAALMPSAKAVPVARIFGQRESCSIKSP